MSAAELGRRIGSGEIDPLLLTETFLDAIWEHDLQDQIYARLTDDRAVSEASAASKRARDGQRLSLLDGVPISWKDLFDTADVGTEAGSRLLTGRVPEHDADVLRIATQNGLVCLGKTHMTELAFSGLGYNPSTATPPCINNENAVPGGSSSGAATSVAFGLAAAGIGSDTGGSVRIPAAWNDLVGLKTTAGRLSLGGVVPLCPKFDTVGPLTRTVEDAALLMAAMDGTTPADLDGASLEGRRFAILDTVATQGVRDGPRIAFEGIVERMRSAGAKITSIMVPEVEEALALSGVLYTGEAYGIWKDVIEARPAKMFPEVLERFRAGAQYSAADYVDAWRRLDAARKAYDHATAGYDAVICPTAPILPPDRDRLKFDGDYFRNENLLALRNTRIGNLMGGCSLSVPTGKPSCGIMLFCPPMMEGRLLRLGAAIEERLDLNTLRLA